MGVCSGLGRILIVVLNLIFFVVGMALTVVGALIMAGGDTINTWLQPVITQLIDLLKKAGVHEVNFTSADIQKFAGGLDLYILIIGIIFLVIAICGVIGACCRVKVLLIIYAILVGLILVAEVAILIIIFASRGLFDTHVKKGLNDTIIQHYAGDNATDAVSVAWNVVMLSRKCCGVDDYTDFHAAENWNRQFDSYTLQTPLVCCKTFPESSNPASFNCAVAPTDATSNYMESCYDSLWKFVDENKSVVIGVTVAILVFQLLLIIFAIVIVKVKGDEEDKIV